MHAATTRPSAFTNMPVPYSEGYLKSFYLNIVLSRNILNLVVLVVFSCLMT